jgi:CheY-like chemotaxis protein
MAHVLVVDDDLDSGDGLVRLLRKRGHRATAAPNGREALALLMGVTPDLIVLDLRMPLMDGPMFLDVMRSYMRLQGIPVMLLTAYPESADVARAKALGVTQVFRKGEDFNVLLDAVDRQLGSSSSSGQIPPPAAGDERPFGPGAFN